MWRIAFHQWHQRQVGLEMPCRHGRSSSNLEKVADRKTCSTYGNPVDRNNYKQYQVAELAIRNFEERWYICTIIFLQNNENWMASPLPLLLQRSGESMYCISKAPSDSGGAEPLSRPEKTRTHQIDLANVATSNPKLMLSDGSADANISEESKEITELEPPLKDFSSTLPKCSGPFDIFDSVNRNSSPLGSECLVNDAPKAEKMVKKGSKKKGKKKGKHRKRTASKSIPIKSDIQCDDGSFNASVCENSLTIFPSCITNQGSDDKIVPTSLAKDPTAERDDTELNNCSTSFLSCTSCSTEMDDSEPISSPQRFASNSASVNTEAQEIILNTSEKISKDVNCKLGSNSHQSECSIDIGSVTASVVDSSLDLNGQISECCSDNVGIGLTFKEEGKSHPSEGEIISISGKSDASFSILNLNLRNNSGMSNDSEISNSYWSSDVLDASSSIERAECSSQACSSNDFQPVMYGKQGRRGRKTTEGGRLEGLNRFVPVYTNGHRMRDNITSIWQKVQNTDSKKFISESNGHIVVSNQDDESTKVKIKPDTNRLKWKNGRNSRHPCPGEANKKGPSEVTSGAVKSTQATTENQMNNVKAKFSSVSKQTTYSFRGDSVADVSKHPRALKNNIFQKEVFQASPSRNGVEKVTTALVSLITTASQPEQERSFSSEESISSNSDKSISNKSFPAAWDKISQLRDFNLFDHAQSKIDLESSNDSLFSIDMPEDVSFTSNGDSPSTKSESESSSTESRILHKDPASSLHKSICLERRDSVDFDLVEIDSLKIDAINQVILGTFDPKSAELVVPTSNNYCLLSTSTDEFSCSRPGSSCTQSLTSESFGSIISLTSDPNTTEDINGLPNLHSRHAENQEVNEFETNLEKIRSAVCEAYKLQKAAEHVQSVTCSLTVDVEKFLHSASPVISEACHCTICKICTQEQTIGHSLYFHHIPNISLRSLWHWYEELGCFGLEVKAHEYHHSKTFGKNSSEFNAYFVPYLSAVQLFAKCKSTRKANPGRDTVPSHNKASSPVTYSGTLPTFPNFLLSKERNGSLSEDTFIQDAESNGLIDGELIFEYFESEQPPRRRPLFEKIKDLAGGNKSWNSRTYGDPQNLESMKLHDLHPASWFSVAWYPIYRIPDGNLRASFLTYHSLGCFVHQSDIPDCLHASRLILCPVVGLQTYNTKGESWFEPRNSDPAVQLLVETHYDKPLQLIKERRRTLKETATAMATAVVSKGDQRSVNHHPDYEFFSLRGS